jgi:hypothetical protein
MGTERGTSVPADRFSRQPASSSRRQGRLVRPWRLLCTVITGLSAGGRYVRGRHPGCVKSKSDLTLAVPQLHEWNRDKLSGRSPLPNR